MENFNLSNETPKVLKHVDVYNKLFALIKNGTYPVGSQLPSEPELADKMNVSRMTLRRSLALLQEDNLINVIRGKGNFVKNISLNTQTRQLTGIQHPFKACCDGKYDSVELEFRLEIPTESILETIQQKTAAVILADRWYKQGNEYVGYSLSFIPIETITPSGINLNDTEQLKEYLEEKVYSLAHNSTNTFSYTVTGNFTATKHKLSEENAFILIQDSLFDKQEHLLLYTKHYIPVDKFKIQIALSK